MNTKKLVITSILLTCLATSVGCKSTLFNTEGDSVKLDMSPLLTVDQPKPTTSVGEDVKFNPVLDAQGVDNLKLKVPYWETNVGIGQVSVLSDTIQVGKVTGVNIPKIVSVSQELPSFRIGTPVMNERPFGVSLKEGLKVTLPFISINVPYPKIGKGK